MQRDLHGYIGDVSDMCQKVLSFTEGVSLQQYVANDMLRLAVERALLNAGEALVCASRMTDRVQDHIPEARGVIALRNVLVHNYSNITDAEIFEIVENEVPALLRHAKEWLKRL
jgi:uncharacterized protein with HEPN domain